MRKAPRQRTHSNTEAREAENLTDRTAALHNLKTKEEATMSNPNMEAKVRELLELKRMKEEWESEISSMEDEIKAVMGDEETLLAGVFKVTWTAYTSSRFDSARFRKEHAELAAAYTKITTTRRFSVR